MKIIDKIVVGLRSWLSAMFITGLVLVCSCDGGEEENPPAPVTNSDKIVVDPATTYQEMVGFGGALSWYSERVLSSSKKNEITALIFSDLGADILRLKNWYYPDNYPTEKSTAVMGDDNSKALWDATNQLYDLAKQGNPNVKVLLSSWGPPAGLKSNGLTRQGTLKKDANGLFMYDAFATYWNDILDNLPFNPEYISIQNEPSYINAGWTTSEWGAVQTASLPGYDVAFDKVYDKIKTRTNPPVMIGPESANIGGNTFTSFAEALKAKPHLGMYAYHPYNFGAGSTISQTIAPLQTVGGYKDKPNIMTEYSDTFSWFNTAQFINNTLLYANTSGYIYWKLVWAAPAAGATDAAMVSVSATGNYSVTPFYYVIKHFSRHIDAGYKRVKATSLNTALNITSFISADQTKLTLVIINSGSGVDIELEVKDKSIEAVSADQSKEGSFFNVLDNLDASQTVNLPSQSITTVVLDI
jgi:glucuronoarabinoxylan endo-1,4-beta-xylanase